MNGEKGADQNATIALIINAIVLVVSAFAIIKRSKIVLKSVQEDIGVSWSAIKNAGSVKGLLVTLKRAFVARMSAMMVGLRSLFVINA